MSRKVNKSPNVSMTGTTGADDRNALMTDVETLYERPFKTTWPNKRIYVLLVFPWLWFLLIKMTGYTTLRGGLWNKPRPPAGKTMSFLHTKTQSTTVTCRFFKPRKVGQPLHLPKNTRRKRTNNHESLPSWTIGASFVGKILKSYLNRKFSDYCSAAVTPSCSSSYSC